MCDVAGRITFGWYQLQIICGYMGNQAIVYWALFSCWNSSKQQNIEVVSSSSACSLERPLPQGFLTRSYCLDRL
jgi:hypothetical protein